MTFAVRKGTIEHGSKYELNMTALYAVKLSLNEEVKDIRIASNADGYGAFDDVLIRVHYQQGHPKLYLLQLKHKLNNLIVPANAFNKRNGDFSVEKYKESYFTDLKSKIEHEGDDLTRDIPITNFRLCVLTNAKLKENSDFFPIKPKLTESPEHLSKKPSTYRIVNCFERDFISTKDNGHHKFEIENLDTSSELHKMEECLEFLTLFRFYDCQVNCTEAEQKIAEILENSFGGNQSKVTEQFIKYVEDHFQGDKPSLLTKRKIKLKLLELLSDLGVGGHTDKLNAKYEVFESITNLSDFNQRTRILKEIHVSLQGKPPVILNDIAGESFKERLSSTFLLRNIGETIAVGHELEKQPKSYIKRRFLKVLLRNEVLWETNKNVFFLTSPIDFTIHFKGLLILLPSDGELKISSFTNIDNRNIIVFLKNQDPSVYVDELQQAKSDYSIHYLTTCNDFLEWHWSWGDVQNLNNFKVKINDELIKSPSCYMVKEKDALQYFNNDINIISAAPGMGKSVILNSLAHYCKFDTLVLRFNLSEYSKELSDEDSELCRNPLDYICDKMKSQPSNLFESELFNHLTENRKVLLLIDAFDEISPRYSEKVLSIIELLREEKITVWMTTRPAAESLIQKKINNIFIDIRELNTHELKYYIRNELKLSESAVQTFLTKTAQDFYSTPLHLFMLKDVFQRSNSNLQDIQVTELYRRFVDSKYDIYLDKRKIDQTINNIEVITEIAKAEYLKNHKLMALYLIFGRDIVINKKIVTLEMMEHLLEEIGNCKNQFGLITSLIDNVPVFSHRTFAEYLVAIWLSENLQHEKLRDIYKILFEPQLQSLRLMFDRLAADTCPLHLAVLDNNMEKVNEYGASAEECRVLDKYGRTPLHLAVSYFTYSYYGFVGDSEKIKIVNQLVKKMHKDSIEQLDCLLNFDWRQYAKLSNSRYLLHTAGYWGQLDVLKMLLKQENCINSVQENGRTALFLASGMGHTKCVEFLLNKGADKNICDYEGTTPFLFANYGGHVDVVKLLQMGTDVNYANMYGRTALHHASFNGHAECVRLLIQARANLNGHDWYQHTPLMLACSKDHIDVVKLLIKAGAGIYPVFKDKSIALHFVSCNDAECVQMLIQARADLNAKSKKQTSPLKLVFGTDHIVIKFQQTGFHLDNARLTHRPGTYHAYFDPTSSRKSSSRNYEVSSPVMHHLCVSPQLKTLAVDPDRSS